MNRENAIKVFDDILEKVRRAAYSDGRASGIQHEKERRAREDFLKAVAVPTPPPPSPLADAYKAAISVHPMQQIDDPHFVSTPWGIIDTAAKTFKAT